jgi:DNA-binding XRE family transcriptional regulator
MDPHELIKARKTLGLTQRNMGARLDLSREHIGRMERGELPIHQTTALAVQFLLSKHITNMGNILK